MWNGLLETLCGHIVSPRAVRSTHERRHKDDQSSPPPKFRLTRCAASVAEKCGVGVIIFNYAAAKLNNSINYISIPCCFLFPISHDRDFDYRYLYLTLSFQHFPALR